MSRVSDVLNHKGTAVHRIDESATVATAVRKLAELRIGALIVVAPGTNMDPVEPFDVGSLVGVFSERDLVVAGAARGTALLSAPVREAASSPVRTTTRDASLETLATEMVNHRLRHLPVVDTGRVVGLVSIGDVVARRVAELGELTTVLTEYVQTGRG